VGKPVNTVSCLQKPRWRGVVVVVVVSNCSRIVKVRVFFGLPVRFLSTYIAPIYQLCWRNLELNDDITVRGKYK